ncbi:ABC transporter substrate-binding protein, partial [Rhizobium ruizarguesonis]
LDGKTYGGFGGTWESALISSMIRNDGGKGDVKTVTLGTSAYEALYNGSIDFTLEIYTWEGIAADMVGVGRPVERDADLCG